LKGEKPSRENPVNESNIMNTIPVMLAHAGGRFGGAVGFLLLAGFVVLVLALALSERSKSTTNKD
jgi:hypothetical protein